VTGFVNEQVRPHLETGKERVARLASLAEASSEEDQEFFVERIGRLRNWQKRANLLLPFALNFIKPD
jgi:hypothetical protein